MNLQDQAVSPDLLSALKRLMAASPLDSFYMAGGTALALRYGHRVSVDIDLFTDAPFDSVKLADFLSKDCGLTEYTVEENTILGVINGTKLDCMAHQYPMVSGVQIIENLRLLAVEDIAAMKLNAIANRGSKKDFWDLYELMQHFSRDELLGFYQKKYPQSSLWSVCLLYTSPSPRDA